MKYREWAKSTDYFYLDVEADSEEEAMDIAADTDGGEFLPDKSYIGDWKSITRRKDNYV